MRLTAGRNPFESCARAIASEVRGLDVEPQVPIRGVGRVDLADLALGIVVECESYEFHSDARSLEKDVRRYTSCAGSAWSSCASRGRR